MVTFGKRQVGARSVAAPLIGVDGYAAGSIAVCGPANRFDAEAVEQFMPLIMEAARKISIQLGWNGVFPKGRTWRKNEDSNVQVAIYSGNSSSAYTRRRRADSTSPCA